ncbi:MAG: DNA repair protein RadC [Alistipes sp.]|nr:DNA repair protein RadC [Alistipes sp.]
MQSIHDKLLLHGVGSLSDVELLSLLIDSPAQAGGLMQEYGSLASIARAELSRLRMSEGLGLRRAESIVVAAELARRIASTEGATSDVIHSDTDAERLLRPILGALKHEECWVLFLSSSNRVVERMCISKGGVQATVVDHRLIVKRALELLSTQLIIAHNHPSGSATPSPADVELTKRIKEAAALFDIRLLDHLIISGSETYSFLRNGQL